MSEPRLLTIMGSGETAPTMAKVHRALFERLGRGRGVPAVLIDTPYGFQENADDLSERIVAYFQDSIGRPMEVASWRTADRSPTEAAEALARIGAASYVLAGPGSPSYALRHWAGGPIPRVLATKLASGGAVTMASAAALTIGLVTIPVYEIYKVGAWPTWLPGLDLLGGATGLQAAVVPHYDNAEGGNHDTRFCYVGEPRLRILEADLPADTFILGVDSHTALILDLGERSATVAGLGGVTVRVAGRSRFLPAGSEHTIEGIARLAQRLAEASPDPDTGPVEATERGPTDASPSPEVIDREPGSFVGTVRDEVAHLEGAVVIALTEGDPGAAVGGLLALDATIERRIGAGEDTPDLHAARATFRSLIVRLGDAAANGPGDRPALIGPFVETLLQLRSRARDAQDWPTADLIRDRLSALGVEVRDDAAGSSWSLRDEPDR
jgi:hypothetical protein